jgi:hypothetical protein
MSREIPTKAELEAESAADELLHDRIVEAAGRNNHYGNLIDRNGYPGKVEPNQATAQFLSHRAVTDVAKAREIPVESRRRARSSDG